MRHQSNRGFTLIEVMIVVVIVAILAAVAIPSYRNHICKVERNQAKSDLLGLAQAMERHYTTNNFSYQDGGGDPDASEIFSDQSPLDGTERFELKVEAPTKSTFTATATRTAPGCEAGLEYTVDSAGNKTASSGNWDD